MQPWSGLSPDDYLAQEFCDQNGVRLERVITHLESGEMPHPELILDAERALPEIVVSEIDLEIVEFAQYIAVKERERAGKNAAKLAKYLDRVAEIIESYLDQEVFGIECDRSVERLAKCLISDYRHGYIRSKTNSAPG